MAARKPASNAPPTRRLRGFEAAGRLLDSRIRKAGESRGFALSRLLLHWPEVAGPELAPLTRPVRVSHGRGGGGGLGATLTLLVSAVRAPLVQMRLEYLRERVNAVYGYNAIARIHLTQTAATGFAEGQADFTPAPRQPPPVAEPPPPDAAARAVAAGVADPDLRRALEQLAGNVRRRAAPPS